MPVETRRYSQLELSYVLSRIHAKWKPEVIAKAFKRDHAPYWDDKVFTKKQVAYIRNTYKGPPGSIKPYDGPIPRGFTPSPPPTPRYKVAGFRSRSEARPSDSRIMAQNNTMYPADGNEPAQQTQDPMWAGKTFDQMTDEEVIAAFSGDNFDLQDLDHFHNDAHDGVQVGNENDWPENIPSAPQAGYDIPIPTIEGSPCDGSRAESIGGRDWTTCLSAPVEDNSWSVSGSSAPELAQVSSPFEADDPTTSIPAPDAQNMTQEKAVAGTKRKHDAVQVVPSFHAKDDKPKRIVRLDSEQRRDNVDASHIELPACFTTHNFVAVDDCGWTYSGAHDDCEIGCEHRHEGNGGIFFKNADTIMNWVRIESEQSKGGGGILFKDYEAFMVWFQSMKKKPEQEDAYEDMKAENGDPGPEDTQIASTALAIDPQLFAMPSLPAHNQALAEPFAGTTLHNQNWSEMPFQNQDIGFGAVPQSDVAPYNSVAAPENGGVQQQQPQPNTGPVGFHGGIQMPQQQQNPDLSQFQFHDINGMAGLNGTIDINPFGMGLVNNQTTNNAWPTGLHTDNLVSGNMDPLLVAQQVAYQTQQQYEQLQPMFGKQVELQQYFPQQQPQQPQQLLGRQLSLQKQEKSYTPGPSQQLQQQQRAPSVQQQQSFAGSGSSSVAPGHNTNSKPAAPRPFDFWNRYH